MASRNRIPVRVRLIFESGSNLRPLYSHVTSVFEGEWPLNATRLVGYETLEVLDA